MVIDLGAAPRVHWALYYPDGRVLEEDSADTSIRLAPDGALQLAALLPDGSPVCLFDLRRGGHLWRPVFYRRKHVTAGGTSPLPDTLPVVGRVRLSEVGLLWDVFAIQHGRAIVCPQHAVDGAAIRACLDG